MGKTARWGRADPASPVFLLPETEHTHQALTRGPSGWKLADARKGSTLTHVLLGDGVRPAIVAKHLIGQINDPVTLNVTHLEKTKKKKHLVKIPRHT